MAHKAMVPLLSCTPGMKLQRAGTSECTRVTVGNGEAIMT